MRKKVIIFYLFHSDFNLRIQIFTSWSHTRLLLVGFFFNVEVTVIIFCTYSFWWCDMSDQTVGNVSLRILLSLYLIIWGLCCRHFSSKDMTGIWNLERKDIGVEVAGVLLFIVHGGLSWSMWSAMHSQVCGEAHWGTGTGFINKPNKGRCHQWPLRCGFGRVERQTFILKKLIKHCLSAGRWVSPE